MYPKYPYKRDAEGDLSKEKEEAVQSWEQKLEWQNHKWGNAGRHEKLGEGEEQIQPCCNLSISSIRLFRLQPSKPVRE